MKWFFLFDTQFEIFYLISKMTLKWLVFWFSFGFQGFFGVFCLVGFFYCERAVGVVSPAQFYCKSFTML